MKERRASRAMESIVSIVLQTGVIISSVMILIGLLLFFGGDLNHGSYHKLIAPNYSFPHSLSAIKTAIQSGNGLGFIALGVLLLILTPMLRVAVSILLFKRQKDLPMTLVTAFVLLVLISSFVVGIVVGPFN